VNRGPKTKGSPWRKKDKNTSPKMRSKGPEATQTLVHVTYLGEEGTEKNYNNSQKTLNKMAISIIKCKQSKHLNEKAKIIKLGEKPRPNYRLSTRETL